MFLYKENWNIRFISKIQLNLPFYIEESLDIFKWKIELINNIDFICENEKISYIDNWKIVSCFLKKEIFNILSKYECWLLIDNWGFTFKWWNILQKNIDEKTIKIEKEFQNTIKQFTIWYSQVEIDSWARKVEEAKKIIALDTSVFITALCIEWETEIELADKILTNSENFAIAYAEAEKVKRQKLKDLI